jgi:triosephosphate isomerase
MKPNTTWLVANWKMNGNASRVRDFAFSLSAALMTVPSGVKLVYCPPAVYLQSALNGLPHNSRVRVGAQHCHSAREGAFTGEISPPMLAELGVRYVILGHSERRAMGETDEMVAAQAAAAQAEGLVPILCVGESEAAYNDKKTTEMLSAQLSRLRTLASPRFLVAYEPVWAIGTGKTPTLPEISAAHSHIKSVLGSETAVLYGGSVNAGNAKEILGLAEVSGALIGGASLDITSMRSIIAAACGLY